MSWLDLQGKVAIVTGGASGIGRACAVALAGEGAHVVVGDMAEEAGRTLVRELEASGGTHLFARVDVTSRASTVALAAAARARFGQIDILVNNAGVGYPALLVDPAGQHELTEEIWDKTVAINQKGCFLCAQAVARQMLKDGTRGVIVNMASESGLEGSEGQSVYAATKAALYSLTRSWAKELGPRGIRVVGLAPGILEMTGLRSDAYTAALAYARGKSAQQLNTDYGRSGVPLGRPGRLDEVAHAVCFVASDKASYISGTVLNISGGKSRA